MREEWEAMPGLRTTFLVTEQPDSPLVADRLDAPALERLIGTTDQQFYVWPARHGGGHQRGPPVDRDPGRRVRFEE